MDAYMKFKAARAIGDAATQGGGEAGTGVGLGAGIGLGAGLAGMLGQAFGSGQQAAQAPQGAPQQAAPAADAPLTRAQIEQAIDSLDLRFSNGEISEDNYNRLRQKWEQRLESLGS
jgi:membrane protease subunit (stomatin/prohibitin family)